MIGFIVTMARAPHTFTPTAQGLLAAFIVLYFGCALLGGAWLFFIEALTYRMWLASFESDWLEREDTGWWGRYVRFEVWLGRVEHAVYRRVVQWVRRGHELAGAEDEKQL